MGLPKLIGWAVIIFVFYAVIAHPTNAAGMTHHTMTHLRLAGDSMVNFCNQIIR